MLHACLCNGLALGLLPHPPPIFPYSIRSPAADPPHPLNYRHGTRQAGPHHGHPPSKFPPLMLPASAPALLTAPLRLPYSCTLPAFRSPPPGLGPPSSLLSPPL